MLTDFEKKFRSVGLDKADEAKVLKCIVETRDTSKLLSYLYIYGDSFEENEDVLKICDYYITNPVPGLTAVCMKVLIDYWDKWKSYTHTIETFLDMSVFDDWYDEVIVATSYVSRNRDLPFPQEIVDKFSAIKDHPELRELFPPKTGEA